MCVWYMYLNFISCHSYCIITIIYIVIVLIVIYISTYNHYEHVRRLHFNFHITGKYGNNKANST